MKKNCILLLLLFLFSFCAGNCSESITRRGILLEKRNPFTGGYTFQLRSDKDYFLPVQSYWLYSGLNEIEGQRFEVWDSVEITGIASVRISEDKEYDVLEINSIRKIESRILHVVSGRSIHFGVWSLYREWPDADGKKRGRTDRYVFGADTICNGKTYQNVICWRNGDKRLSHSAYGLREDATRLYAYNYAEKKEYMLADYALRQGEYFTPEWVEETEQVKNPVYRVLSVGDTALVYNRTRFVKIYDTVYGQSDLWLPEVGSWQRGIAWDKYQHIPCDTVEKLVCMDDWRGEIISADNQPCYIPSIDPFSISGQSKLYFVGHPFFGFPEPDCCFQALAMGIAGNSYILSNNAQWTIDHRTMLYDGVEYNEGDSVEVKGVANIYFDLHGYEYRPLEIQSMKLLARSAVAENDNTSAPANALTVSVHPNPNNGNFKVEVNRPCSVEIYTETGVLVESRKLDAGTHNFSLGTDKNAVGRAAGGASKAAGLYILKASAADGQMLTRKIAVN